MSAVKTTCPYCGVGCGVIATPRDGGGVDIAGDPDHPANFGRLCSKGLALGETFDPARRLLHPEVGGARVGWDAAIALVAERFGAAVAEHGPDSVAFYVSGQLLTEDYYVANKLMKGFIGAANIDTNSRLCMSSAVAGHRRAFGADVVPCSYTDLEDADLVVLVGSNLAWCHPVLFQRLLAAREERGTRIVAIDPRRSATAEMADLHLAIAPQSDVALFNGLFHHLDRAGHRDERFNDASTENLGAALDTTAGCTLRQTAEDCGLSVAEVRAFFDLFAAHPRVVTAFSMGVNQSESGTDKVNAIVNCHLLTGRISKPGAGPFSITGQPNAMGGREVGGLANMLAAHMDIENADHRAAVRDFWRAPRMAEKPGLKAVDLFKGVHDGRIKALWIMATNPAVSMPDSGFVDAALAACPFVVVSDVTADTDTARHADVLLPAQGWGEKRGSVTNAERRVSRQRRFMPPVGEARADWRIVCDVAKAMGFSGFDFSSPDDVFAEHAALTRLNNAGARRLDLSTVAPSSDASLAPAQWGGRHPFADGRFQTPTGRARYVATRYVAETRTGTILNTGRIRDQWHTMTRTGLVPRLFGHRPEPALEIHPSDVAALGLVKGGLVEISAGEKASLARAEITSAVQPGVPFMPMHWSDRFARSARVNAATAGRVDPVSGQPALKSAPVSLRKFDAAWYGFGVSLAPPAFAAEYLAHWPLASGYAFEAAGGTAPENWQHFLDVPDDAACVLGPDKSAFRVVAMREGKLAFAFFASRQPVNVGRAWLQDQLGAAGNAIALLAGVPAGDATDQGPLVCACMGVGAHKIEKFIAAHPAATLDQVCAATSAGTGCGSCRIDIKRTLAEKTRGVAAE